MVYEIAGVKVAYNPTTKRFSRQLKPFRCDSDAADICITLPETARDGRQESVEMLRLFSMQSLMEFDSILLHGAAVSCAGKAYVFVAPSGTGKTTHAKLWEAHVPGAKILNGDKPFLRCAKEEILVCGSPWQGKEDLGENKTVPLAGIFLLAWAAQNSVQTLSPHQALPLLMNATVVPRTVEGMETLLSLMERILEKVPVCTLHCNMDPQAAKCAFTWTQKETELCG